MEDLKIDERYLEELTDLISYIINDLQEEIENLNNENIDIFTRYMAFCRLCNFINVTRLLKATKNSFLLGYALSNEVFKTEEAKINGWMDSDISQNPFFINSEKSEKNKSKKSW